MNRLFRFILLPVFLLAPSLAPAGNLEPAAPPAEPASAVYSTDDLYNRLQTGAAGARRTGGFTEPAAMPADGVGKSLDDIMAVAPAASGTALLPGQAPAGKTFWGLQPGAGSWGPQTGTNTNMIDTTATAVTAAATADIKLGRKAFVNGAPVTGTLEHCVHATDLLCLRPDGTIRDKLTGLVWLQNARCGDFMISEYIPLTDRLTMIAALASGMCGLSDGSTAGDWRMPTPSELMGLSTKVNCHSSWAFTNMYCVPYLTSELFKAIVFTTSPGPLYKPYITPNFLVNVFPSVLPVRNGP